MLKFEDIFLEAGDEIHHLVDLVTADAGQNVVARSVNDILHFFNDGFCLFGKFYPLSAAIAGTG